MKTGVHSTVWYHCVHHTEQPVTTAANIIKFKVHGAVANFLGC